MEAGRPRALLGQDLSTRSSTEAHSKSSGRVAQDKLTLQRNVQRVNPYNCPVTRPPRPSAIGFTLRRLPGELAQPFGEISGPEIESLNYLA